MTDVPRSIEYIYMCGSMLFSTQNTYLVRNHYLIPLPEQSESFSRSIFRLMQIDPSDPVQKHKFRKYTENCSKIDICITYHQCTALPIVTGVVHGASIIYFFATVHYHNNITSFGVLP